MNRTRSNMKDVTEKGAALLIAIFALMLISAVAISLVLMSGTGSAIDANYRNSSKAFYSALAGLEEARGRLAPGRTDTIFATLPNPMSVSPTIQVQYILNPAGTEVVAPTTLSTTNQYADNEFGNEFGVPVTGTNVSVLANIASDSTVLGLNGPTYKWVRVTGITEKSENMDVDGNGVLDNTYPIFYVNGHQYLNSPANAGLGGNQVYRVTALAVMPDNSRRMLQYDVTMNNLNLNLPSPLTLAGPIGGFAGASSMPYHINGSDGSGTAPAVPGCTPSGASLPAVGTTDATGSTANKNTVISGIPRPANYTGGGLSTPSVADVGLTPPYDNPTDLNQALQTIQQNANVSLGTSGGGGSYNFANITSAMPGGTWPSSSDNPQIVYVDGNFDLGPNTGSGLLVVTGNFTYAGNSGWNGLILVVGEGTTTFLGSGGGSGQFDGGIFVATTKDSSGNLLSSFGTVNYDISGGGGNGIYYNSCWITNATNSLKKFQELSFREILNF